MATLNPSCNMYVCVCVPFTSSRAEMHFSKRINAPAVITTWEERKQTRCQLICLDLSSCGVFLRFQTSFGARAKMTTNLAHGGCPIHTKNIGTLSQHKAVEPDLSLRETPRKGSPKESACGPSCRFFAPQYFA